MEREFRDRLLRLLPEAVKSGRPAQSLLEALTATPRWATTEEDGTRTVPSGE